MRALPRGIANDPLIVKRRAAERKLAKAIRGAFAPLQASVLGFLDAHAAGLLAAQEWAASREAIKHAPGREPIAGLAAPGREPVAGLAAPGREPVFKAAASGVPDWDLLVDWGSETARLQGEVGPILDGIIAGSSKEVEERYRKMTVRLSWDLWDAPAKERAEAYKYGLIKDITDSTRGQLGKIMGKWIESDEDLPALRERIRKLIPTKPWPGMRDRAELIAQTETTRIYAETRRAGMKAAGLQTMVWRTAEDEIVCPICRPLGEGNDGEGVSGNVGDGAFLVPAGPWAGLKVTCPSHPGCRCWVTESAAELEALSEHYEEVSPLVPPEGAFPFWPKDMRLDPDAKAGPGIQGGWAQYIAPDGSQWTFRSVGNHEIAFANQAAANLAEALELPHLPTYAGEIGGEFGVWRALPANATGSLSGVDLGALTKAQVSQIQQDHYFDWLTGNHWNASSNLLTLKDGSILPVGKDGAFGMLKDGQLSWDYNPLEPLGITGTHNDLLARFVAGDDVIYGSPYQKATVAFFDRVEALEDAKYISILRPWAEAAHAAGHLGFDSIDDFFEAALSRKNRLRLDVTNLWNRGAKRRRKILADRAAAEAAEAAARAAKKPLTVEGALTPIDDALVSEIEASGWQGKAILFGGQDVENMTALIYRAEGDGTLIELKIRQESETKLLSTLTNYGAKIENVAHDPYFDQVLTIAKDYNASYKHGQPMSSYTAPSLKALHVKLQAAGLDDLAAAYYRDYVADLVAAIDAGSDVMRGKKIAAWTPPAPKAKPRQAGMPKITQTTPWNVNVANENGRIVYTPGKGATFSGTGYDIDFGDGIKAHYIRHGDGNGAIYSKQGRMVIQIDGQLDPDRLSGLVEAFGKMGLDGRLANKADVELMYLVKNCYAATGFAVPSDLVLPVGGTVQESIEAYKGWWNTRLGVKDVGKLKSYNPIPYYDTPAPAVKANPGTALGLPRWQRFDITEADLDKKMKDYALGHTLYNGNPEKSLTKALEHNGALIATEEKYRIGVNIGGMSPAQDQGTGGASYVFTRIADKPMGGSNYHLMFDKRLLLDTDAISYGQDLYGNSHPADIANNRQREIADWKRISRNSGNETIIKRTISIRDHLVGVNATDEFMRTRIIDLLKRNGITTLGGRPLIEAVRVMGRG